MFKNKIKNIYTNKTTSRQNFSFHLPKFGYFYIYFEECFVSKDFCTEKQNSFILQKEKKELVLIVATGKLMRFSFIK